MVLNNKLSNLFLQLWAMHDVLPFDFIRDRIVPYVEFRGLHLIWRELQQGRQVFDQYDLLQLQAEHRRLDSLRQTYILEWRIHHVELPPFEPCAALTLTYEVLRHAEPITVSIPLASHCLGEMDAANTVALDKLWGRTNAAH